MNINPAAAASVAGTARAAARGGESDNQATESSRQQSKVDQPAGASADSAVNAGDETQDRGGDGRQVYDTFERAEDEAAAEDQENDANQDRKSANTDGVGGELDLEA